jgi:hypothetical protein
MSQEASLQGGWGREQQGKDGEDGIVAVDKLASFGRVLPRPDNELRWLRAARRVGANGGGWQDEQLR